MEEASKPGNIQNRYSLTGSLTGVAVYIDRFIIGKPVQGICQSGSSPGGINRTLEGDRQHNRLHFGYPG